MNKGMIIVGLLLLVGMSFASSFWQYPWQGSVAYRYHCLYEAGEMYKFGFAYAYLQPTYMSYSEFMDLYNVGESVYGYLYDMMYEDYYPADFKADMLGYNSAGSEFNTLFNAALRHYLALSGESGKALVSQWIQNYQSYYYGCLMY